ncbi:MAG: carboxypeptidase regulatory-like domain-containing protein [Acidobacteriia bacterium]|nr:carboxypeptidase regulatory-like domain-containing protein [Terriglobia bacterium]
MPLTAQVDRASLNGVVTDASGALVPGAKVEAVSSGASLRRQTTTGPSGTYEIPGLAVGTYTVTFSKDGFKSVEFHSVEFAVGQPRTIDARLEVGSIAEAVEVTAPLEAVNRTSAEVGGLVEAEQIKEIPVSGRNWASLMLLAPGAINYGDGAQRSIRFNGHSLDDNNFAFDGIDTSGIQEQTQKADTRLNIALDAIAEFRVSTAVYTAESGAAGGAQIDVVSKTGSNGFHGSGFYAVRNDALDSRSPFDGSTIPPFTLDQFGASLGGAIVKNKVFFYGNYEGLRQSLGQTFINYVPNAAFRAQAIAKSPVLKPILDAYTVGQIPVDSMTDQVAKVATDTVREDAGMFRLDYRFTDNTTAFVRYNVDNAYIDSPTDALGGHNVVPHIPTNVVLQLQHIFSPVTFDEVKFGINRANYHNWGYGTSPVAVNFGSNFDGVSDTSLDTEVGTSFSYIDNLTLVRGRHTLKAGVEIRRIRLNNSGNTLTTSSLGYDTPADFINNSAASATYLQGEGVVGNRRTFYMGYFQDDFKASQTLTLNLGLRYEYYSVMHEILNRSAVVDILGCAGFCPKGTPYYSPNTKDFGPRLGLAWAPAMFSGKTTIRTGFGIYFGGNQNDDFSDPAESAVPRYSLAQSDFPALSYPLVAFLDPKNQLFSPKAIDRYRKDLSYNDWDLMIQQELPRNFLAQVGYLGAQGHHLFSKYTVNLINPLTGKRPLPNFGSFGLKANDGNNNFNALQASLQRRFTHGFLFQTNYMWSHGIADASIGSGESLGFQNMACRACDRSSTNIDVRHTMTMNAIYELPFGRGKQFLSGGRFASQVLGGWKLAGIATARTGLPVNITMSRKAAALPDGNTSGQRPNLVPGEPIYAANPSISGWFNPAAFSPPASGTWGNLGRYIADGPSNYEIDSSLQKRFRVTERLALNLRAAAYNLLNHPQYKTPSGSLGSLTGSAPVSAGFGKITGILNTGAVGSGAPRRVEFMLRAEF